MFIYIHTKRWSQLNKTSIKSKTSILHQAKRSTGVSLRFTKIGQTGCEKKSPVLVTNQDNCQGRIVVYPKYWLMHW